jgi:hypothetical protein
MADCRKCSCPQQCSHLAVGDAGDDDFDGSLLTPPAAVDGDGLGGHSVGRPLCLLMGFAYNGAFVTRLSRTALFVVTVARAGQPPTYLNSYRVSYLSGSTSLNRVNVKNGLIRNTQKSYGCSDCSFLLPPQLFCQSGG